MSRTVLVGFSANMEMAVSGFDGTSDVVKQQVAASDFDLIAAGSSFNVARALLRSGQLVKLLCTVGDDRYAGYLEAELRRLELDAFPLPLRERTNITVSLSAKDGAQRIIAGKGNYLPDAMERGAELIRRQVDQVRPHMTVGTGVQIADAPLVLAMFEAGGRQAAPSMNILNPGISLVYELSNELEERRRHTALRQLLSCTDLLAVNEEEEAHLLRGFGFSTVSELQAIGQGRHMEVLVTRGPKGATLYNGGEQSINGEVFADTPIKDLTGAGDTFLSCYIGALLDGKSKSEALRWAAAGAAITISRLGGSSVPSRDEITQFLAQRETVA
ncbi:MAG: carbohydrate kinase family protein [Candidatus Nomurabacteria bacterium]|nr:MAG: carbohydrate kinase family protein [Candidatus Nomurabacteria bacterium]